MPSKQEATTPIFDVDAHDADPTWSTLSYFWANTAGSLAALAAGLAIITASQGYALVVNNLPGPGFYPLIIGIAMTVLALVWCIGTFSGRHAPNSETGSPPEREALIRSGIAVVAIAAFMFALRPIGYPVSVGILTIVLVLLARGSIRKALATGPIFAISSYLLITSGLGVPLGLGILEPLLG
ncbi:tripartite tricarboxylate transporter TctB family protein [Cellulosimicrobium funkei]|nr:tripartite tricarboxylate transporter TctB family protein [Cellulosimicrobium funkei]